MYTIIAAAAQAPGVILEACDEDEDEEEDDDEEDEYSTRSQKNPTTQALEYIFLPPPHWGVCI